MHFTLRLSLAALAAGALPAQASDFPALSAAWPSVVSIATTYPVFDFDTDGCLPSAGISRSGAQNGGLNPSGSIIGGCRRTNFLDYSNTVHRHACMRSGGASYCVHFYALYFLKDQATPFGGGHRHDWEHAAVWTTNGVITHAGYSAHGKLTNAAIGTLATLNGHPKFVYHKDGALTHAMRFAGATEYAAENPYGSWVLPALVSWTTLWGDGVSNATMRSLLNGFDYGSANLPVTDGRFLNNINSFLPPGYPAFTASSMDAAP
ncbi:NPP1 family protein [Pelomonas sp. P7]|uniref:NPP1 family protein n=1 Tax=Pelomonas caseinilytica TaxID=2906763 RepID=A0ABS8XCZ9_9BURK|nr:NPP1 family protein [Pelomonas sp. P7]MCE4537247.1 NPP1 family protein [Pelomonas sp. P7]